MFDNFHQIHSVKVKVNIKKLYLKVRFPCSISFQLKNQINFSQTKGLYPLTQSVATVNQTIELEIDAELNTITNRYQSKKIQLIVYMSSTNGKVIAGSVKFDTFQKSIGLSNQFAINLQKCPDKNAKILFSQSIEYMRTNNKRFQKSTYSYINELKHLSPRTNHRKPYEDSPPKTTIMDYKKKPINSYRLDLSNNFNDHQKSAKTIGTFSQKLPYPTAMGNRRDQYKLSNIQSDTLVNNRIQIPSPQRQKFDSKVNQSIKQKKNIERIKTEINFRHKQEVNSYENRIQGLREDVQNLNIQIENYKQRFKQSDKRQKNASVIIKELKQQLDKKKAKDLALNGRISELETLISIKEKQNKQAIFQKKLIQDELQKQRIKIKTEQKKYEIKLNSLNEQLNKITEKYKQSQKQKDQSVSEYNNILNKLQQSQKRQQLNVRDKDKLNFQQKNKFLKKIDQLNDKIGVLNKKIQQQEQILNLKESQIKQHIRSINQSDIKTQNMQSMIYDMNLQINKDLQQIKITNKEIQNYKQIEIQKNALKKKSIEQQHQITSLKDKNSRSQITIQNLQKKQSELDEKIKLMINQKNLLMSNQTNSKRQIDKYEAYIKKMNKDSQTIQVDIEYLNKIVSQYKNRIESDSRIFQQEKYQYEAQISRLVKEKNSLEKQITQFQWKRIKEKQNYQGLEERYHKLSDQNLTLNQQLIQKTQKIKKLEELIHDNKTTTQNLKNQNNSYHKKNQELNSALKSKDDQIYDIRKKLHQAEQQIFLTKDKLIHIQSSYKQKTIKQDKRQRQKEDIMDIKVSQLSQAQSKLYLMKEQLTNLKQQISLQKKEIQHQKFLVDQNKGQSQTNQQKVLVLKQQKNVLEDKINKYETELKIKTQSLEIIQRNLKKSLQQYEAYKQVITESLQNLLIQLSKQQQKNTGTIVSITLKGIMDPKISKLQIQLIQKRNSMILNHKSKIFQLEQALQMAKIQVQKYKQAYQCSQKQKQQLFIKQRQKIKVYEVQTIKREDQLNEELRNLQQKLFERMTQIQRFTIELMKQKQINEQLNMQIHLLINQIETHKDNNRELYDKISEMRTLQTKDKALYDLKFNELSVHFQQIIVRLRNDLYIKEKQLLDYEKKIQEKNDLIKKIENILHEQKYQKQKYIQLYQQIKQKNENLTVNKDQVHKRFKQQEKKNSKLFHQVHSLSEKIQNQKIKKQDLTIKYQKIDQQMMQIQLQNQKLKLELQNSKERTKQLQLTIKQKGQVGKIQIEKYLDEINNLKDSLIHLRSEIDLKSFLIKKGQQALKTLKQDNERLFNENKKKKQEVQEKNIIIDQSRSSLEDLHEKMSRIQNQKNELQIKIISKNNMIESLNSMLSKKTGIEEQLQKKIKQVFRLKDQRTVLNSQKQKEISHLKSVGKSLKSEISSARFIDQENKKKIRQLQYILQQNNLDLYQQKRRWNQANQKQKQQIFDRIRMIQNQKDNLQEEFRFEKDQLKRQLQSLTEEYNQVVDKIKQIYTEKNLQQERSENLERKNQQLSNENTKLRKGLDIQQLNGKN